MRKSIYSLALLDDVVEQVDALAFTKRTSRSNMINRILAEYLSCSTPEKLTEDVFFRIQELLDASCGMSIADRAGSMLSLRSALTYKYNPTLRYSVELRPPQMYVRVKVYLRTQNDSLLALMRLFCELWSSLAQSCGSPGKALPLPGGMLYESDIAGLSDAGRAITRYIELVDSALKAFFSGCATPADIETMYRAYYAGHYEKI